MLGESWSTGARRDPLTNVDMPSLCLIPNLVMRRTPHSPGLCRSQHICQRASMCGVQLSWVYLTSHELARGLRSQRGRGASSVARDGTLGVACPNLADDGEEQQQHQVLDSVEVALIMEK